MGGQFARWAVAPVEFYSTPKRKATPFIVVHLIPSRRVRRRNLSAKGCPPIKGCLPTKGRPPDNLPTFNENFAEILPLFYDSGGKFLIRRN
ncbi:MAG: hypothetical protein LBK82_11390 [Planctomycetaceae bacterium]|nr:hypothetical protein [Planctomycetaceae bacterium]